jgi:uncharacterized membrane protein (Fun14 family)
LQILLPLSSVVVVTDQLISSAGFPLIGGGLLGFCIGWAIKKIVKPAFIAIGLLSLFLGYLEYKHWISVNWTVAENQSSTIITNVANKIATVTQHEIPIGVGVLGFMPGLVSGLYKG